MRCPVPFALGATHRSSGLFAFSFACAIAATACNGEPTSPPSSSAPTASSEAPTDPTAAQPTEAEPTSEDDAPAERTCDFVPTEVPVGGVTCPEGCLMIKGAPLHQTQQCAMTGFAFEVALACLRLPMEVIPEGACYRDEEGHVVLTALTYPALADRGWSACPDDGLRQAPPCADRLIPPGAPADGETPSPDAPAPTEDGP
jgi:hypothetical protein